MKSMQIKMGLIRDKRGIYSGLLHSQSLNHQLAVCYNSDGKLIVKIAIVREIVRGENGTVVTLISPDASHAETVIDLDRIESIYPIRDFVK